MGTIINRPTNWHEITAKQDVNVKVRLIQCTIRSSFLTSSAYENPVVYIWRIHNVVQWSCR